MDIDAIMVSCAERSTSRLRTLADLETTDFAGDLAVVMDDGAEARALDRITATWCRALAHAADSRAGLVWLMEDDLEFNRHIADNIRRWPCLRGLRRGQPFFGSLYNPTVFFVHASDNDNCFVMDPQTCWGAQSLLVSPAMAGYFVRHWSDYALEPDLRMPRLASHCVPVYYHRPSLVQHVGDRSTWGAGFHQATDYDRAWRAPGARALMAAAR